MSEQQVFDQLAHWSQLNQLSLSPPGTKADLPIALDHQGEVRRITVSHGALVDKTRQRLAGSFARLPEQGHCLVMPGLAQTPTLLEALQLARPELHWLLPACGSDAFLTRTMAQRPQLFEPTQDIQLLQQLERQHWLELHQRSATTEAAEGRTISARGPTRSSPSFQIPPIQVSPHSSLPSAPATHLLRDGLATPIDRSLSDLAIPLGRRGTAFVVLPSDEPIKQAGNALAVGTELVTGACFSWGDHEALQLIAIAEH